MSVYQKTYEVPAANARLLIVHGLGEYADRYAHVAAALNKVGLTVHTFDLSGHGHSDGSRAYFTDIDTLVAEVDAQVQQIPTDLPLFLLGHSLGGLIALRYLLQHPQKRFAGAIFSGAALEFGNDVTPVTKFMVKTLAAIAPQLKTVAIKAENISRDAAVVADYTSNPLIYQGGVKAGTGLAMIRAIGETKTQFGQLRLPTLIMHGGADSITNPEGSKALYAAAASADKTLKIWEGAYHEIFNETNKEEVLAFLSQWLQKRITA